MIFAQIASGMMGNFSYVLGSERTKQAAVIDPPSDLFEILNFAKKNSLKINLIFATHSHADHTGGINALVKETGARVVVHKGDASSLRKRRIQVDKEAEDGEKMNLDGVEIQVIHTPGHTPGSMCLLADGKLFTGDTLFVGNCGRSDLAGGNTRQLYDSLCQKLKKLSDDVLVYPGHDYGDRPVSTIGHEKKTNPTLTCKSFEEFQAIP